MQEFAEYSLLDESMAADLDLQESAAVGHKMTSHDAFLFVAPLPAAVLQRTDHRQNMWSAESRVIWVRIVASCQLYWMRSITECLATQAMKKAGMRVTNPCMTLKTYHEHCSEDRSTWMANPLQEKDGSKFRDYGQDVCRASPRAPFSVLMSPCAARELRCPPRCNF